jgi:hypothetical protein
MVALPEKKFQKGGYQKPKIENDSQRIWGRGYRKYGQDDDSALEEIEKGVSR